MLSALVLCSVLIGAFGVFLTSEKQNVSSWSDSDIWVVFSCGDGNTNDIYLIKSNGSNLHHLTNSVSNDLYPMWSPDGNYVAFSRRLNPNNADILIIQATGQETRRFNYPNTLDILPNWSSTGNRLSFSTRSASSSNALSVVEIDTREIRDFDVPQTVLGSAWDHTNIIFSSGNELLELNTDTLEIAELATANSIGSPSVSLDNQWISVSYSSTGLGRNIGLIPRNGGEILPLTDLGGASDFPRWSSSENVIYFLYNGKIMEHNLENDESSELLNLSNYLNCGVYSFDVHEY